MIDHEFVRPARPDDASHVETLLRAEGLETEFVASEFLVCESNGRLVACARARRVAEGGTEFSSLVVVPSHRGRGISRELFSMALLGARHPVYALTIVPELASRAGFERIPPETLPESLKVKANRCSSAGRPWLPMRLQRRPLPPAPAETPEGAGFLRLDI